jgi:MFS family permease
MTRGFSAFHHPNYRLYFAGQSISLIGTWMQIVAQAWLVLKLTNSAADLGIVSALQSLPILFIGTFGGVFADRLPKRRLLVMTQIAQMLLAFLLGVLVSTHVVQIWHVYLLATMLGVATAFDAPVRQSFVMEMVGRRDLMNAVALNSTTYNGARIVGPAIAGILIGLVGVTSSFYLNGISFLFVIGGLLLMRPDRFYRVATAPRVSMRQSLAGGFHYVRKTPAALTITALVGVLGLFAFNTQVLIPLFAANVLHVGATGLGVLFSAMGVGSVAAGLVAAFSQRARWSRILIGAMGMGVAELGFAFSHSYPVSILLMVLTGLSMHTFFTSANTGIQQRVPDQLRGRVMGIYMTVNMGTMPFGNLAAGGIASAFGAPAAMAAGAIAALAGLSGIGTWMLLHRATADFRLAVDDPAAADRRAGQVTLGERSVAMVAGRPDADTGPAAYADRGSGPPLTAPAAGSEDRTPSPAIVAKQ